MKTTPQIKICMYACISFYVFGHFVVYISNNYSQSSKIVYIECVLRTEKSKKIIRLARNGQINITLTDCHRFVFLLRFQFEKQLKYKTVNVNLIQ